MFHTAFFQPRDPKNVGMTMRSHAAFGGGWFVLIDPLETSLNAHKLKKTARSMNRFVETIVLPDFSAFHAWVQEKGFLLAAIEIAEQAVSLPEFNFPETVIFLLGNEVHGIPGEILQACEVVIRIPQNGRIGSLNVSVAASLAMYEYSRTRIEALPVIGSRFDIQASPK